MELYIDSGMTAIDAAVAAIFARPLPPKYNGRKDRWKAGKMGLASKIRLLEEFGYKVDITITPPEKESPIFLAVNPEPMRMRQFRRIKTVDRNELP